MDALLAKNSEKCGCSAPVDGVEIATIGTHETRMEARPIPEISGKKLIFLESIRGVAAFVVVVHHLVLTFFPNVYSAQDGVSKFVRPILKLFVNGSLSVRVFFVLSGFVLSLSFFRTQSPKVLPSAALRRYFRLVVPVFIATMLGWVFLQAGFYWNVEAAKMMAFPPIDGKHWLGDFGSFGEMNFWEALNQGLFGVFFNCDRLLNSALWTMPIELAGSFLVFSVLSLFGGVSQRGVIYVLLAFVFEDYFVDFICGIAMCDLYTRREKLSQPLNAPLWVSFSMVGVGLFLGGGLPGWLTSHAGISLKLAWHPIAATMIVGGTLMSKTLRRVLELGVFAFLGKISFSIYVIHMPIILSFGCWAYVGLRNAMFGHAASASLAMLLCIFASVMAAWGLYYAGDIQGIRLGRLVERMFFPNPPPETSARHSSVSPQ